MESLAERTTRAQADAGLRLTRADAEHLYTHASLDDLQSLATAAKTRWHDSMAGTYLVMAIVNYTNVCVARCDYCSFYRLPHESGTYLLSPEEVIARVERLIEFGGTLVSFNGGFHPKLRIHDYANLFQRIRAHFGGRVEFFEMTVAEFMFACKVSRVSYDDGAQILRDVGTRWVTGGGAEILDDAFRLRHSPGKYTVADYFMAQQALLHQGIGSTATMVIGFDETLAERMNHLDALRAFQDRAGGALASFLCWTYKPFNNRLGGVEVAAEEYWRWLAICRLYLDNFRHIRTSVLTQNENALLGLRYGADDFDLPTEDEVTQKAGATISHDFARILAAGAQHGLRLTHRDPFQTLSQRISAQRPGPVPFSTAGSQSTSTSCTPA